LNVGQSEIIQININPTELEINTDYYKMMKIVLESGYNGYVGIEYEGSNHTEIEGIRLTLDLLKKVRDSIY